MTVEELIDELMKVNDKKKPVKMIYNTGTDFDEIPFIEEGIVMEVGEEENRIGLIDDMTPMY